MQCRLCSREAVGACRSCGGFYCQKHGGVSLFGPQCVRCFNRGRPLLILQGILLAGLGVFALLRASGAEVPMLYRGVGIVALVLGAWSILIARRSFPR